MTALKCTGDYIALLVRSNIHAFAMFKQQLRRNSGEIASTVEVRVAIAVGRRQAVQLPHWLMILHVSTPPPHRNACSRSLAPTSASSSSSATTMVLGSASTKMSALAWR